MNIICVGAPQTGKTTFILDKLKNTNPNSLGVCEMFDEYKNANITTLDHEELIEIGLKTKCKTFVFEDCTPYFQRNQTKKMSKLLSTSMGHLHHNIFLSFHYLNTVPPIFLGTMNYLYYTKTIEKGTIAPPLDKIKERYKVYNRNFFYR